MLILLDLMKRFGDAVMNVYWRTLRMMSIGERNIRKLRWGNTSTGTHERWGRVLGYSNFPNSSTSNSHSK